MAKPFLLLEPGPLVPDEPHQRGDAVLLDVHTLGNIAAHVLSGRLQAADYQSRIMCVTDWRRKGAAYDLAPLAQQFPASNKPDFKPLSKAAFDKAFALAPGGLRLTEAEKGDLLQTNLGGFGTPSATAASGGAASAGTAAAAPAPRKIKLKVKGEKFQVPHLRTAAEAARPRPRSNPRIVRALAYQGEQEREQEQHSSKKALVDRTDRMDAVLRDEMKEIDNDLTGKVADVKADVKDLKQALMSQLGEM